LEKKNKIIKHRTPKFAYLDVVKRRAAWAHTQRGTIRVCNVDGIDASERQFKPHHTRSLIINDQHTIAAPTQRRQLANAPVFRASYFSTSSHPGDMPAMTTDA
jgi:hypothetical protein